MAYEKEISKILEKHGRSDINPRHIEAWMFNYHGSLDHLSKQEFENDVKICIDCVDGCTKEESEELAISEIGC